MRSPVVRLVQTSFAMTLLIALALSFSASASAQNNMDPSAAATAQALLCERQGGTAHLDTEITAAGGMISSHVMCLFGWAGDGWACDNDASGWSCIGGFREAAGQPGTSDSKDSGRGQIVHVTPTDSRTAGVATDDPVVNDTSRGEPVAVDAELSMAPLEDEG